MTLSHIGWLGGQPVLLSKYEGLDGRTPYERRRGRRCNMVVLPFGERVLYKQIRESKERKDKFESEDCGRCLARGTTGLD